MNDFDCRLITDEAVRTEYLHLQWRAERISASISQGYGQSKGPIGFRFINENEFNAFASLDEKSGCYQVEINAAVPLLVMMLFYRLFSDERILPHLDSSGRIAADFELPFIVDPEKFDQRVNWQIKANAIRGFAAGTIADLCNTFVVLHEFGHVMCGHTEGIRYFYEGGRLAELVSRSSRQAKQGGHLKKLNELRKAWEGDADMIASIFLAQFVDDLAHLPAENERTRRVFSDQNGFHLEHTLAIAVSALFGFFCYVQGARHQLDKQSDHPHPHVRALYLKDMLLQEVGKRRKLDSRRFHELLMERLDEMMRVLIDLNLFEARIFSSAYDRKLDRERKRLATLQTEHRDSCAKWRWFAW